MFRLSNFMLSSLYLFCDLFQSAGFLKLNLVTYANRVLFLLKFLISISFPLSLFSLPTLFHHAFCIMLLDKPVNQCIFQANCISFVLALYIKRNLLVIIFVHSSIINHLMFIF